MNIEKYLDNELSNTERIGFEAAMSQDASLQREVETQRKLRATMQQMALREKVQQNFQEMKAEQAISFRIDYRMAAAIFGICLVAGLAYWNFNKNTENQIVTTTEIQNTNTNTNNPTPETKTWRDAETPTSKNEIAEAKPQKITTPESGIRNIEIKKENKLTELTQKYIKYSKTVSYKKNSSNINPTDSIAFLNGINALTANQAENAGRFLMTINEESNLYKAAQWYFVLSLIQRERLETAKNMLQDIANDENQPFKKQAANLLLEIEGLGD